MGGGNRKARLFAIVRGVSPSGLSGFKSTTGHDEYLHLNPNDAGHVYKKAYDIKGTALRRAMQNGVRKAGYSCVHTT